jgi:hypothetical protein
MMLITNRVETWNPLTKKPKERNEKEKVTITFRISDQKSYQMDIFKYVIILDRI